MFLIGSIARSDASAMVFQTIKGYRVVTARKGERESATNHATREQVRAHVLGFFGLLLG